MAIPKEILAVERPKNTIVVAYGKNKDLYAVRQRIGCRNVNGRHLPVNGPTVGHIVDYCYVPIDDASPSGISDAPIDMMLGSKQIPTSSEDKCPRFFPGYR